MKPLTHCIIALAISFTAAAPVWAQDAPADTAAKNDTHLEIKVDPVPATPRAGVMTSYAPVVEKVMPSVVTIATEKALSKNAMRRGANPMLDELLKMWGVDPGQIPGADDEDDAKDKDDPTAKDAPRRPLGLGSGSVVSPEGHILTNNHVIRGADEIFVLFGRDKTRLKAKLIAADPATDLAVIKLEKTDRKLQPITFADSDKVRVGDAALAVGSPFGYSQSVSLGIISAKGRGGTGLVGFEDFIQTDAAINMGNSGGPLVDADGRLIGVNSAILGGVTGGNIGIGFAVPSNMARTVMESLIKHGRVIRGMLGVVPQDVDSELAEKFGIKDGSGAIVVEVSDDSPAAKAGIEAGDVITAINDKKIEGERELRLTVSSYSPGSKVAVKLLRGSDSKTLTAELAELQGRGARFEKPTPAKDPDVLDGVSVGSITDELRKQFNIPASVTKGAVVTKVNADSHSAAAGIRAGDIILEIERKPVADSEEAVRLSEDVKKMKNVLLRVSSRGQSRYVVVGRKD